MDMPAHQPKDNNNAAQDAELGQPPDRPDRRQRERTALDRLPQADNVRALVTGAALAASVEDSPAVLVNLYDYAHRYGAARGRRTA